MKSIYKCLLVAVAAVGFLMTASNPSQAVVNKFFFPKHKEKIQHRKELKPAHHIINVPGKKRDDFSNLNR